MKKYFFIYGTLKKSNVNNKILKNVNAKFIGYAETIEKYPMFDIGGGFPYLQDNKGIGNIIEGELWKIDDVNNNLKTLDWFEGVPDLYKKGNIDIELENLKYINVNVYFKTQEINLENIKLIFCWKD